MSSCVLHLIIISGMSGSGKSTAARALEDAGFFVVDNLPVVLLKDFLRLNDGKTGNRKFGVVVDVRTRDYLKVLPAVIEDIRADGHRVDIFFFDASEDTLIQRYSETRRRHPLIGSNNVPEAIEHERVLLRELENMATLKYDSSGLSVHELRRKVFQSVVDDEITSIPMSVHIQSFGFRYGIPAEADMVLDVRFLTNPYFVEALRPLSGLDKAVTEFIVSQSGYGEFFERLMPLLEFLLPQYEEETKSYFTLSIGCTGGRHRSVAIAEDLYTRLSERKVIAEVLHRDIYRGIRT